MTDRQTIGVIKSLDRKILGLKTEKKKIMLDSVIALKSILNLCTIFDQSYSVHFNIWNKIYWLNTMLVISYHNRSRSKQNNILESQREHIHAKCQHWGDFSFLHFLLTKIMLNRPKSSRLLPNRGKNSSASEPPGLIND